MSKGLRIGVGLAVAMVTGFVLALTDAPLWVGLIVCAFLAFFAVPFIEVESWRRGR